MTETTSESAPATPGRVLAIFAHADDIEFTCAGTIARWVREGYQATYVICTDSSKGSEDPTMTPRRLADIRVAEQRAAAAAVGVDDVVFLGFEDGMLEDNSALRRELVRLIRQRKPNRVICGDPTVRWFGQGYVNHPDHIAAGNAALAATYPFARNRPTFPELLAEGLEPHKVAEVYISSTPHADTWIDIGDTIDLKVAALKAHPSQLGEWDPAEEVRKWAADTAKDHGMTYAEAYKYLKLD